MQFDVCMRATQVIAVALVVATASCATTSTETVWTSAPPRLGRVEAVQETVRRIDGNPVGGAIVGGLIGALLFRRAPIFGAAAGAGVGAAASSGSSRSIDYHVIVDFDDGAQREFVFAGYDPFIPGDRVALTPRGLERR
jgi:outer membrane lipoprotein SlyB